MDDLLNEKKDDHVHGPNCNHGPPPEHVHGPNCNHGPPEDEMMSPPPNLTPEQKANWEREMALKKERDAK